MAAFVVEQGRLGEQPAVIVNRNELTATLTKLRWLSTLETKNRLSNQPIRTAVRWNFQEIVRRIVSHRHLAHGS